MSWDGIEKRQGNRKPGNFQPQNMFETYVKVTLDNMEKKFDKLPCSESFQRIGKCEIDIANIKGRATILGAIAGIITGFVTKYILGK